MKKIVGIHDKLPVLETIPLSLQHLMAMFGATVLVPILFGIDPAVCLLMNGIGTLIYSIVTKGGIPAYLGSSFAFLAPTFLIMETYGSFAAAQVGFIFFGLFFVIMAFIIKKFGTSWIDVVMPPAVMGSVVAVIGLELAPVAASQAGLTSGLGLRDMFALSDTLSLELWKVIFVSVATLTVTVVGSVLFKGFAKIIPILIGVIVGYIIACFFGMINFTAIIDASWIGFPKFTAPVMNWSAVIIIAPACLVVLAEHIGHLIVTAKVTDTDLMKDPGLYRSLLGDGLSNILSGLFGSSPNTTYGENIGVMAITRVYSVWVIRFAAGFAILFSLIPKFSAAIQSIPTPVMGGITIYLYGVIGISGIRMLVEQKVDFSRNYNMAMGAVVFALGVSGAAIKIGQVELKGMALAAVVGIILAVLFHIFSKLGIMNEKYEPKLPFEQTHIESGEFKGFPPYNEKK